MTTTTATVAPEATKASWPSYLAVIAGGALLLKAGLIIGNGGGMENAVTGVLYLGGLLLALVSAIGAGITARRGRRTVTAVGLVLLLLVYVVALSDGVGSAFGLISDEAYVNDEGPIGLLGALLIAAGIRGRR